MKSLNKIFVFAVCLSLGTTLMGQAENLSLTKAVSGIEKVDGPVMTFESMIVDYGTIERHSEPLRIAKFTNTGNQPLVISNARGSCGCTVPNWPKEPVMPGETSQIEIRYDTKRLGKINKTVTISTNEGSQPHVLRVQGLIQEVKLEDGVPAAKKGLKIPNNN